MGRKIAIVQSNYIPWKGYFDLINLVDEFILFDDMQYTRRDWRNRNKIKAPQGSVWLTIPVRVKGKYFQKIKDTVISDSKWNMKSKTCQIHNLLRLEGITTDNVAVWTVTHHVGYLVSIREDSVNPGVLVGTDKPLVLPKAPRTAE